MSRARRRNELRSTFDTRTIDDVHRVFETDESGSSRVAEFFRATSTLSNDWHSVAELTDSEARYPAVSLGATRCLFATLSKAGVSLRDSSGDERPRFNG